MSNQIAALDERKIQQVEPPVKTYDGPKNFFVAKFMGQSDILKATMKKGFLVTIRGIDLDYVDKGFAENGRIQMVIRPEDVEIPRTKGQFRGRILSTVFKRIHYEMVLDIMDKHWLSQSIRPWQEGEEIWAYVDSDNTHVMKEEDYA